MKLKIFFVIKLFFFVSVELSAPYAVNEYQQEFKSSAVTGDQIFGFYSLNDSTLVNAGSNDYSFQRTAIMTGTVD